MDSHYSTYSSTSCLVLDAFADSVAYYVLSFDRFDGSYSFHFDSIGSVGYEHSVHYLVVDMLSAH